MVQTSKFIGWIGSGLLFLGILIFITFYAANSSGILSTQYLNNAIGQIANASVIQSITGQGQTAANVSSALNQLLSHNPNCNILCLASGPASPSSTNTNPPISPSSSSLFQLLGEIIAVVGVVLIFFSYDEMGNKLVAIGRGALAASIISFVSTYIPFVFMLPYLISLTLFGLSIKIPVSVIAPFANLILTLDIIFGVIGVILMVIKFLFFRTPKSRQPIMNMPKISKELPN
jgi:hypothetical protein